MTFFSIRVWLAAISLIVLPVPFIFPSPATAGEPMVAVLLTGNLPHYQAAHEAFMRILKTGGYGPGKLQVFVQTPNADKMSLSNSVRRTVAAGAQVLIVYGAPAAEAARKERPKVPVVFADVYDPVAMGLVKSLAAPGTDMTGASSAVPLSRLVEEYQRIRPIKQMGVLFSAAEAGSAIQADAMSHLGKKGGFKVLKQDLLSADRLEVVLPALLEQVDTLFLAESVPVAQQGKEILAQTAKRGVPVLSTIPGFGEMGAVLNLEADPEEQGNRVAVHLLQILAGQKAHMLPVRTPKKVSLVINRGAAGKLSLVPPPEVVSTANRVIE